MIRPDQPETVMEPKLLYHFTGHDLAPYKARWELYRPKRDCASMRISCNSIETVMTACST